LRLQAALTQAQLASLANVSRATISRGEAGEEIRISSVAKLARALRCRPADLLQ
jgi:transcriptional regulator with XRE-family HTH domain